MAHPSSLPNSSAGSTSRFLSALASEIARTADEIEELGKIILDDVAICDRSARRRKLEVFGLLTRKCSLNANLVAISAHAVDVSGPAAREELLAAISEITLEPVRDRLRAAMAKAPVPSLMHHNALPDANARYRRKISDMRR